MTPQVDELVNNMTEFLKSEAKTETIIGQQFTLGEWTCVPVMSVGMGFGAGAGEGKDKGKAQSEGQGTGGGAGIGISPTGFLVSRGADIHFIPANNPKGISAAIEKIPDVIAKFAEAKEAKAN